jgi:hypothetical protein
MLKKIAMTATAAALALGGLATFASPSGAAKINVGNATGSVDCSGGGKVKIKPGLMNEDGPSVPGYTGTPRWVVAPALTTAKLKLVCSGTTGNSAVSVTSAKVVATSQGTEPGTCSGLTSGSDTDFTATISWKASGGTINPSTITYSGFEPEGLGFRLPETGGTATITGSYAGGTSEAHAVLAEVPDFSRCDARVTQKPGKPVKVKSPKGLKKLVLSPAGTLSVN